MDKTKLTLLALVVLGMVFFKDQAISLYRYTTNRLQNIEKVTSDNLLNPSKGTINTPPLLRAKDDSSESYLTLSGVISQTNKQRVDAGLPPLKENVQLNQSATSKMKDMFKKQYFAHESPTGVGVDTLAKSMGYDYIVIGENLALGNFANDKALVDAWMNSPGHRANILNKKYQDIGVAVGKGMYEGHMTWIAVQHFGMPASACTSPDQNLKAQILQMQTQVDNLQAELTAKKQELDNYPSKYNQEYNNKVNEYNQLVENYNSMVNKLKLLIGQYNNQVNRYNQCAS